MSATTTLVACCVRAAACLPDDALVVAADLPRAEALRVLALQVKREVEELRSRADTWEKAAKSWKSLAHERNRELRKRQDQLDEVEELLKANGCDCGCDHGYDDHEDDCERCFACRVSWIVSGGP